MKNLSEQGVYRRPDTKSKHPLIPIGEVFGWLVVLENDLYKKFPRKAIRACRVRCKCSKEFITTYNHLRSGKSTSCGCRQGQQLKALQKARNPLIPIGTVFGRRTVLENHHYKTFGTQTQRACLVRCQCGAEDVVTYTDLRGGNSESCGCISRERNVESVWYDLLEKIKRRGWECHLTIPQLKLISQLPCAYCGKEPSNVHRLKYKVDGKYQRGVDASMEIHYSGLDRVDSSQGYIPGNLVPCCRPCNRMKTDFPLDMFYGLIERIRSYGSGAGIRTLAATLFAETV